MNAYEVDDFKSVFFVRNGVPDGKIKPLIISISVGVVLHEEDIGVSLIDTSKSAKQVSSFEL